MLAPSFRCLTGDSERMCDVPEVTELVQSRAREEQRPARLPAASWEQKPPDRGGGQVGHEEGRAERHMPPDAIVSDISAESSVPV